VTFTSELIADMAGNALVPISSADANYFMIAQKYVDDTTAPVLLNFSLNMDLGSLQLTFSETVRTGSLRTVGITLQSQAINTNNKSVTLSGGETLDSNQPVITVHLSAADVVQIKSLDFCLGMNSSFLLLSNITITDTARKPNAVLSIRGSAKMALSFSPDITPPRLMGYVLNLNPGSMQLTFNEPVRPSSSNVKNAHYSRDRWGISYWIRG